MVRPRRGLSVPRGVRAGGSRGGLSSPFWPCHPLLSSPAVIPPPQRQESFVESPPGIRPTPGLQVGEPRTFKGPRKPPDAPGLQHRAPSCPCTQQSSGDPWSRQPRGPASSTVSGFACPASPACLGHLQAPLGVLTRVMGREEGPVRAGSKSCCSDHPLKTPRHRDSLSPEPSPDGQSSISDQRSRPVPSSQLSGSVSSGPNAKSCTACLHPGNNRSAVETHPSRVDPPLLTPQLQALAQPPALSSV